MTTKQDVKQAFKTGKGDVIAKALREYFAQGIAEGRVKPLTYYKAGEFNSENSIRQNEEKKDIVEVAQQIFAV